MAILTTASVPASGLGSVRTKLMATLFVAQVCGSTGQSIVLAVGSILAASITGTNTWSGLPVAVGALGTALASWPLARLMARSGRRPGLALGYGLAVMGALLGVESAASAFLIAVAGYALAALLIQIFLRPDPLSIARRAQEIADTGRPAKAARRL